MWTYGQSSGKMLDPAGNIAGTGYSGHGLGINNPALQDEADVGPIPQGQWTIGESFVSPTKGPVVMALTPADDTVTFGRSGFLIHGDSVEAPGAEEASLGCIILPRNVRQLIANSSDRDLLVTA